MKHSRRPVTIVLSTVAVLGIAALLAFMSVQRTVSYAAAPPTGTTSHAHVNIAQSGTQVNFSTTSVTLMHNTKNTGTLYFVNQTLTAQIVTWSGGTSTIQAGQRARVSLKIGTTTFTLQSNKAAGSPKWEHS
jgi:hypothetical protein